MMNAETLLNDLRTELLALMMTAVDGLAAKARTKLEQAEKEAAELKAKGLAEVADSSGGWRLCSAIRSKAGTAWSWAWAACGM